jgi:peptide chain release factor 1
MEERLTRIVQKHSELRDRLAGQDLSRDQFVAFSKEYSDLTPVVADIERLLKLKNDIADLQNLTSDQDLDEGMRDLAQMELEELLRLQPQCELQVKRSLLPKDKADEKNAILEIRAGTGGEEAALFGAVLFRMYQRYAERKRWKFEVLAIAETGMGGYKEATASISGQSVFARLKFESGVHRVQRVPETESSGRIHTSAATVAVLAEAEEVDIELKDEDLRIDVFRSSGPGGQSVNTTDSAVRIVHIPTGLIVQQQDEKSQHKNKAKALKILRSRLYDLERSKQESVRAAQRKGQVGSGDRSERIRTYNFPDGRVSDHRINLTLYKIQEIVEAGDLDEIIEALIADYEAARLSEESAA